MPYTANPRSHLADLRRSRPVPTQIVDGFRVTSVAQTLFDLLRFPTVRAGTIEQSDGRRPAGPAAFGGSPDFAERRDALARSRRPQHPTWAALVDERSDAKLAANGPVCWRLRSTGCWPGCHRDVVVLRSLACRGGRRQDRVGSTPCCSDVAAHRRGRRSRRDRHGRARRLSTVTGGATTWPTPTAADRVLRFTHAHLTRRPDEVLDLLQSAGHYTVRPPPVDHHTRVPSAGWRRHTRVMVGGEVGAATVRAPMSEPDDRGGGGVVGRRCGRPRPLRSRGGLRRVARAGRRRAHRPYDRPPLSKQILAGHAARRAPPPWGRPTTSTPRGSSARPPGDRARPRGPHRRSSRRRPGARLRRPRRRHRRHAPPPPRLARPGRRPRRCAPSTTAAPCGPTSTPAPARCRGRRRVHRRRGGRHLPRPSGLDVTIVEPSPSRSTGASGERMGAGHGRRAPRPRRRRPARHRRRCASTATAASSRCTSPTARTVAADVGGGRRRRAAQHRLAGGQRPRRSTTAWSATTPACAAPGIVAAGDVARWSEPGASATSASSTGTTPSPLASTPPRTLAWPTPAGGPGDRFAPVPWFWSDQYDRKIQVAGRTGAD